MLTETLDSLKIELDGCHSRIGSVASRLAALRSDGATLKMIDDIQEKQKRLAEMTAIQDYLMIAIQVQETFELWEQSKKEGVDRVGVEAYQQLARVSETLAKLNKSSVVSYARLSRYLHDRLGKVKAYLAAKLPLTFTEALEAVDWPCALKENNSRIEDVLSTLENWLIFEAESDEAACGEKVLERLMRPIRRRFVFNFHSNRPTNRIDKPEWFFDDLKKILGVVSEPFMELFHPLLAHHSPKTSPTLDDLASEFVKLAEEKLEMEKENYLEADGQLLSHVILQATRFHEDLGSEFGILEESKSEGKLQKCLMVFLDDEDAVNQWLQYENRRNIVLSIISFSFLGAWQIYHEIIAKRHALSWMQLTTDFIELFSELNERFVYFAHLSTRIRYFSEIIVPLLEAVWHKAQFDVPAFHESEYDARTAATMWTGLGRICHVMETDWGEHLSFIEMAASKEFKMRTGYDASKLPGTVFNKSLNAFEEVREKLFKHIVAFPCDHFEEVLRPYASSLYKSAALSDMMNERLQATLLGIHQDLSILMGSGIDSIAMATKFIPCVAERIEVFWIEAIILKSTFGMEAAKKMNLDLQELLHIFRRNSNYPLLTLVMEMGKVLALEEADLDVLKDALGSDDFELAPKEMTRLGFPNLTLVECERLLSRRR